MGGGSIVQRHYAGGFIELQRTTGNQCGLRHALVAHAVVQHGVGNIALAQTTPTARNIGGQAQFGQVYPQVIDLPLVALDGAHADLAHLVNNDAACFVPALPNAGQW
ncbi:hypothetical protein D3C71_1627910 [compost metagenome]